MTDSMLKLFMCIATAFGIKYKLLFIYDLENWRFTPSCTRKNSIAYRIVTPLEPIKLLKSRGKQLPWNRRNDGASKDRWDISRC